MKSLEKKAEDHFFRLQVRFFIRVFNAQGFPPNPTPRTKRGLWGWILNASTGDAAAAAAAAGKGRSIAIPFKGAGARAWGAIHRERYGRTRHGLIDRLGSLWGASITNLTHTHTQIYTHRHIRKHIHTLTHSCLALRSPPCLLMP